MSYFASRINRYIMIVFFKAFLVCTLGITVISFLFDAIEVLRRMMTRSHITLQNVIEILILKAPVNVNKLLPFVVLAAAMLTFSKLNGTSEVTVMRSFGISRYRILASVITATLCVGAINLTVMDSVRATFTKRLFSIEERLFGVKRSTTSINFSGLWLKDITSKEERILHSVQFDLKQGLFNNVTVYRFGLDGRLTHIIKSPHVILKSVSKDHAKTSHTGAQNDNASFQTPTPPHVWELNRATCIYHASSQSKEMNEFLILPTNLNLKKVRNSSALPHTLSLRKLSAFITLLKRSGLSTRPYVMHMHKTFAAAALLCVMAALAAGFCLRNTRQKGTSILVAACIFSGLGLHFMHDFFYALGLGGRLSIPLAAWAPTVIAALLALSLLIYREEKMS